eukprot:CAMPEP_0197715818 /NCGR_PEP_ID=MMETSP1434-20131217/908_1 /TAXON_ID=265543 /ORGANISM="Minutocellus polymorphus, Strain CCMP3303" /LENGTH=495 /DNA_ID=CAMNT_0043300053 /DNA_START=147 /DNA_END=1634 /DNA_ORIENTATION=-
MPHLITVDPSTIDEDMRDDVPTSILENQSIIIRTNPSLEHDIVGDNFAVPAPKDISKAAADVNEAFIYDDEDDDDNDTNPTTWTSSYDDDDDEEQWEGEGETVGDGIIIRERDAAQRRVTELEEELGALTSATQALARLVKSPPSPTVNIADDDEGTLDHLIKQWRLEDTGFVSLYSSCRALQSNLALTQAEADVANEEMRAAKSEVSETKSNLATANKALRQLWKENAMIKQERKALVRDVRKYVKHKDQEARDEIDRTVAFIAHEHSFSSSISFDRNNTGAMDDELSLSSSVCSNSLILPGSPSVDSDCDSSATLRIKEENVPLGDLLSRSVNNIKSGQQQKGIYKITIENRKEIGIILLPLPKNPCRNPAPSEAEESPSKKNILVGLPLAPLDGIGKIFRRKHEVAFVVMGFADIDTCASDKRPLLGSRLVAVDSVSLEGQGHTLKEVCGSIRSREGSVTLSFRNDTMSEVQISYLNEKFGTNYSCSQGTVE